MPQSYDISTQARAMDERGTQQLLLHDGHPYMPIDKALIPYSAEIRVGGTLYLWEFNYNAREDFFTVGVADGEGWIIRGEPLIYGSELFAAFAERRLPGTPLVPIDLAREERRCGWKQLGDTVYLFAPPPDWETPDIDAPADPNAELMGGGD